MTEKTKTIKVETRCWWVTPQRIELVDVKQVVDTDSFYVEFPSRGIPGEMTSATVEMNALIAFDDVEQAQRRMLNYIDTAKLELARFERGAERLLERFLERSTFPDDETAERGRDGRDPEIAAMEAIVDVLSPPGLTSAQLGRIIDWTKDRFDPPRI